MSGQTDFKPVKRHKADIEEWLLLRRLKGGPCRICGRNVSWYPSTLHHLVGRDLGGDDVPDNLVPLCGSGSSGCHGLVEERSRVACESLRESLTSKELAYVRHKKGVDFLDRYYPSPVMEKAS